MNAITTTQAAREHQKERADLVGRVVWGMVREEAERKDARVLLQLVGMHPEHLLAVANNYAEIEGKKVTLAIASDIDETLCNVLDPRFVSEKPAVHFRHLDNADVIVFAVTDDQRDTVGTSLGQVTRLDRNAIQDKHELWLEVILERMGEALKGEEQRTWIRSMLRGLDQSGITKELDQYAEFVRRFASFSEHTLANRLRLSAPALRLPKSCFGTIPQLGGDQGRLVADFRGLFRTADRDLSGIPYLLDSKEVRLEIEPILNHIAASRAEYKSDESTGADAIEKLIEDRQYLRHGDWRKSQERFCEDVEWNDFGKSVFAIKARKKAQPLSLRTRDFIREEYPDCEKECETYLTELEAGSTTPEQDQEFFAQWQDAIRTHTDKKLYEHWRRHLFTEEVKEADLLSTLVKGIRSLLIKNASEDGAIASNAVILIKIKNGEKTSAWTGLNPRLVNLLRLEGRLLQGVVGDTVKLDFGKWLEAKGENTGRGAPANQIEFELRLQTDEGISSTQVRAFWQPGFQSMALSWPEDIEEFKKDAADGVIRYVTKPFSLKQSGAVGGMPASLSDTSSFIDVSGGERGLMANPADHPKESDQFTILFEQLDQAVVARTIDANARDAVAQALTAFRSAFSKALLHLYDHPETLYASDLIEDQARTFGTLCQVARTHLSHTNAMRERLLRPIVEFAIVSATNRLAAIIPAWHPLRLLERKAKSRDLARFVEDAIHNEHASVDGLERATDEQQGIFGQWFFPKVISLDLTPFVTVEDCGGYSLAVPVDSPESNEQMLETTAEIACKQFMQASDRFIELNPHEEGNFSTALYNADAVSLAGLVAKDLEKRMTQKSHLRASLLITHDSPERLREVYAKQNTRLSGSNLDDVTEGFLSRLRVGVGKGETPVDGRRSNIDVVYLHNAFFKHATMTWELVDGAAETLAEDIDFRNAALPRRRTDSDTMGNIATQSIEVFMTASRPPRAAAQFTDLCYVADEKNALVIPADKRIVPIQKVDWDNQDISRTIRRAHELGEWVISVDTMSSRQMLSANGIKVIRDVQLPDVEMRVLVSSREPSQNLLRHLRLDFESMADTFLSQNAEALSQTVINTVVEVCGQKILSSAKSRTTAREIMGLAAATALVNAEKTKNGHKPAWFSLDDNQAFFGLKGRMADTLALTINNQDGRFVVDMTVVEAKCVGQNAQAMEAKSSTDQVVSTLATIEANFVIQKDVMAKRAWGRQLLFLMSLRPDYIHFFASNDELEAFRQAIAGGDIEYRVDGRSVVVVHDDVALPDTIGVKVSEKNDAVFQHTIKQRSFSHLMQHLRDPSVAAPTIPAVDGGRTSVLPERRFEEPPNVRQDETAPTNQEAASIDDQLHASVGKGLDVDEDVVVDPHVEEDAAPEPVIEPNPGLPPTLEDVLREVATRKGYDDQKEAEAAFADVTAVNLQAALTDFGMTARFAEPRTISTPNGVLVNFAGHNTLTVGKLTPKLLELKTTHGLDVTDIRTGLGRISLFVAAQRRRVVDLARVWLEAKWPSSAPEEISNFLIGLREDTGDPLWLNLRGAYGGNDEHSPHTLIAGETGSGKGVLTQNLLLQMIALNTPDKLKLYLIDPKMGVDFPWISEAPHMAQDIITDQEESKKVLETIVYEMDRRYELIKTKRVPKIAEYNALVEPEDRLPYLFVIHDEMADWMAGSDEYRKVIQSTMTRLASKARACGIHVIMITQRAAQDAIPPGIRDNLGNRLILKVASEAGSNLALGMRGAERLLGKGHIAARLTDKPSGEEYFVAQVPFASTEELDQYARTIISGELL
ncbi:FtsK/SpoIIIE domain-containing protein [Nitratireductor sp. ZSWI3]|uniref:FtsK/SpoIIIE domain-containing protein n=1 Tax=Nitratireductor sp. ZSWI3 TaxID=2966359 RepID=UPI00214FB272|nr:FtsK/SpoIIIE domain-containing protein [Nitratireductor sp. ZSWI3]MCR4266768.1 FtsK/SpoIIIE domain-containing protein [Nitratireductor sp. ZSWI3]